VPTVSWNRFEDHDKVMLIGSTDNPAVDTGKLHVSLHYNLFRNVGQRTPRVRFGQVHVYNNLYSAAPGDNYLYSWGVGVESSIFAENNVFLGVATGSGGSGVWRNRNSRHCHTAQRANSVVVGN
jgi:pectate lyase